MCSSLRFVAVGLRFFGCLLCIRSFVVGRLGVRLFVLFLATVLETGLRVFLVAAFGTGGFRLLSVVLLAADTSAYANKFGFARNL